MAKSFQNMLVNKLQALPTWDDSTTQYFHMVEQTNGIHPASAMLEHSARQYFHIPLDATVNWETGVVTAAPGHVGALPTTIDWNALLQQLLAAMPTILQILAMILPLFKSS